MTTLRTERLVLVPVDVRNAHELWTVLNEPDLRRYQDIPRVRLEEFERQVRARPRALRMGSAGRFEWIIRIGEPARAIGWVSLRIADRRPDIGEVGYSLVEGSRGFGYATEALAAVVDAAFAEGELGEIQACCVPANQASKHVLARVGFAEARLLARGAVIRGRPVDVLLYTLPRARWHRARVRSATARRGSGS